MKKTNFLIVYFILSLFLFESNTLKCGEEQIENCEQCGAGESANTCMKCKDKYFPVLSNLFCLACDDPLYGQAGCGGQCDASNYLNDRNVKCNENDCKEGYYNLNDYCIPCSEGSHACKKCKINLTDGQKVYTCEECISNEYRINDYGECRNCFMSDCKRCHYIEDSGSYKAECDECNYGYYLDENKECSKCKEPTPIENGQCSVCSNDPNDYESGPCWCDSFYTQKTHSTCVQCPQNCLYCEYNQKTNKAECMQCDSGYTLNSEKTCTFCGAGCEYCLLSDNSEPKCVQCFSGTFSSNNKCLVCPDNCKTCDYDSNNEIKCSECSYGYTLISDGVCAKCPDGCDSCKASENDKIECLKCYYDFALNSKKECDYCQTIEQKGMSGCQRCGYNGITEKYECYECKQQRRDDSYYWYDIYSHVTNTFECFNNSDPNEVEFYGCLKSYYNDTSKRYECQICNAYKINSPLNFIMVKNEKICKEIDEMNLMNCYEAENIGTKEVPIYSCIKCYESTVKIIDKNKNNRINCYSISSDPDDKLSYCSEGEIVEGSEEKCTKCVSNAKLNNNNICECNPDSFGKYNQKCYKCDDVNYGSPGCNAEKGCSNYYYSNDQLNCNECKDGYFNFTEGQCFSCSFEINNCEKCHYDNSKNKLICDKCPNGYSYNSINNKCETKNCEEYPEIYEGCIICEENRDEYISNKKCHKCKTGYFKTKDEQCVHCMSEKYGGPNCYKCKYELNEDEEETNNIICDYCPKKDHLLSSDGKCYFCKSMTPNCEECGFIKNADNTEKLSCTLCNPGYYLNSEGKCIFYLNFLERIPNCFRYAYTTGDINFCTYNSYYYDEELNKLYDEFYSTYYCKNEKNDYYDYYYTYSSLEEYKKSINNNYIIIPEINSAFKGKCIQCQNGYDLDSDGNCVKMIPEDCTLISIYKNLTKFSKCIEFCNNYNNIYVELIYKKKNNDQDSGNNEETSSIVTLDTYDFFEKFYYGGNPNDKEMMKEDYEKYLKPLFAKAKLCFPRPENSKEFRECQRVQYDENTNTYKCSKCYSSYVLDTESNSCKYIEGYSCNTENVGTNSNPIYSCKSCYNDEYYSLITIENNVKLCIYKEEEIKYCTEANADTSYVNTVYNCTNCSLNFLPYYSKFFGRKICQNIFDKIITKNNIAEKKYEGVENVNTTNGICENNNFFTPDGRKCYKCDNEDVGMPGCKGACNFSSERNNILKCEEGCKTGYIEVSEGVCETCDSVNHGCYECHYENEYPDNYLGVKRKRRFVCDYCQGDYIKLDGQCLTCRDLDLDDCDECAVDPKDNNKYICTKCNKFSVLEDNGECDECDNDDEFIKDNKCLYCNDYNNGGVKGCEYCEKNNNDEVICRLCQSGYILLTNNNTCLNISENNELKNFYEKCEQLTLDNNQLYCSRCKLEYSLLKENDNDKGKCTKISILYNNDISNIGYSYNYYYQLFHHIYSDGKQKYEYYDEDYYYYSNYINYPCQESVNLGTKEKPIYSCTKCYQYLEYDKSWAYRNVFTRIINKRNNVAFCIYQYKKGEYLENCTEATNNTKDGIEKYDCLKCFDENKNIYNSDADIHYCQYANVAKKCMVQYCKTCKTSNNYFCNECILSNYEVNSLTGSCVEKSEIVPAITFKDIFRLEMNSNKTINGQTIYGPSLRLRGITSSQINTKHAFLIYLTFKIKSSRNRNLQEEKKIPAICEAINSVEESSNDVNMIDYECIGNATEGEDFTNYKLDDIDEGENNGLLKKSNLKELTNEIKKEDKGFEREEPIFTLVELLKYVTFELNEIQNITAKNYLFDFKIDGKINKEVPKKSIDTELEINEIEDKAICKFNIEEDKSANLECKIDIKKYKEQEIFTFKTAEIKTDDNDFYLAKIDEVLLINDGEEKKKDYTVIIIVCVIAGVLIIAGITILIVFLVRKSRKPAVENEIKDKEVIRYSERESQTKNELNN